MDYVGIDIGSTAAKTYVLSDDGVLGGAGTGDGAAGRPLRFTMPTGWSSIETARKIQRRLADAGIDVDDKSRIRVVSTGYGREAVGYADDVVTEITCHGKGGSSLVGGDCTVIDVGGQDTKMIAMSGGTVTDFLMNDKCAAGTGKFVEVMANRLNVEIDELFAMAQRGTVLPISSLCTVFAESEVINLIGSGETREDIAAGIVDSVASKVAGMCAKRTISETVLLTGGLSQNGYFAERLGKKLGRTVLMHPEGRYAGAYGAALIARTHALPHPQRHLS